MQQATEPRHYQIVERAIEYIHAQRKQQPSLAEIAAQVAVSELHLQRIFLKWAGISVKRFLQYLTKQAALEALQESQNELDASLSVGLSGPSRLHDLMVCCEAMTPGEIKLAEQGMLLEYAFIDSPFGAVLLAWTTRGICYLQFVAKKALQLQDLFLQWPNAKFRHNQPAGEPLGLQIFTKTGPQQKLHLLLKGTNFQTKVWEAVLGSQQGQQLSYAQVSTLIAKPNASRAVGSALANNMIAYLIPCHRVIKSTGALSNYRWGSSRKAEMQIWEKT